MIVRKAIEGGSHLRLVLRSGHGRDRPGRRGPRHHHRLPFLRPEVIAEIADAVVYDAAQPAEKRAVIGMIEVGERPMGGKIGVLEHVDRFNFLAELRPRARSAWRANRASYAARSPARAWSQRSRVVGSIT